MAHERTTSERDDRDQAVIRRGWCTHTPEHEQVVIRRETERERWSGRGEGGREERAFGGEDVALVLHSAKLTWISRTQAGEQVDHAFAYARERERSVQRETACEKERVGAGWEEARERVSRTSRTPAMPSAVQHMMHGSHVTYATQPRMRSSAFVE